MTNEFPNDGLTHAIWRGETHSVCGCDFRDSEEVEAKDDDCITCKKCIQILLERLTSCTLRGISIKDKAIVIHPLIAG